MKQLELNNSIEKACKRIAPAWPLENSVAVNPYLGMSDMTFEEAAETLLNRGDIKLYMPLSFYQKSIDNKEVQLMDIEKALTKRDISLSGEKFVAHLKKLLKEEVSQNKTKTLLQYAQSEYGISFSEVMIDATSSWLSTYFKQVGSNSADAAVMFESWKKDAAVDLYPEIKGLHNFRTHIKRVPKNVDEAIEVSIRTLGITPDEIESYLHSVLLQLIGWSSYCSGVDWHNNLYKGDVTHVKSLLAILLSWECAIHEIHTGVTEKWHASKQDSNAINTSSEVLSAQAILQDAYDFAFQRKLNVAFGSQESKKIKTNKERPAAQMVFCIDVRSEVYRRQLETVNPSIDTVGFAGFFGFPIKYTPINHEHGKNQCPVLLPSGPEVFENTPSGQDINKVKTQRQLASQLKLAWSKFKSGSISSYSFVSPLGVFYLPKLLSDSFGWTQPVDLPKEKEFGAILKGHTHLDLSNIPLEDQVAMAKGALTAMGISKELAPFVLIAGHGSSSVNNPHASGLDCGACGGNSGEVNAITAQLILNNPQVRQELNKAGIAIPEDTVFLACLHNTTTDEITIINKESVPTSQYADFRKIEESLLMASEQARAYRSARFGNGDKIVPSSLIKRANDWSQIRPEWGLSGCSSFVVAPRDRSKGIDLEGKAFLHSYDWKTDEEFTLLETIMTAPMVVTSWINLQYYASTVDNEKLGAGNKTLHNVTAGLGVLEGAKGDLRIGLPMQSIHDGTQYQHLPLRLNVIIEAPIEAINDILLKHENVRALCDNNWISLLTLDEEGKLSYKYDGNYNWESCLEGAEMELQNAV